MNQKLLVLPAFVALIGCSQQTEDAAPPLAPASDAGAPGDSGEPPRDAYAPPDALSGDALAALGPCIVSLDCPTGTHCDLGACTQDCNDEHPCPAGKICGPRARCIDPGTTDHDPAPDGGFAGALSVSPSLVMLSGETPSFTVKVVVTGAAADVPYRVELAGAHLSVSARSGTIHGGTQEITVAVDPSKVSGAHADGTVSVVTPLGTARVVAPIDVGIGGAYRAVLVFDGDAETPLGAFPFVLAMTESNGQVLASVDPARSPTFVDATYGEARGGGTRAANGAVELTLRQRIAQAAEPPAGVSSGWKFPQAPLQADVFRTIALHLTPSAGGDGFEGTFDETDDGLLSRAVVAHGHVSLARAPGDPFVASTAAPPSPPTAPAPGVFAGPPASQGGQGATTCAAVLPCGGNACPTDVAGAMKVVRGLEDANGLVYYPYLGTFTSASSTVPFGTIADTCKAAALSAGTAGTPCGNGVPLGCALGVAAGVGTPNAETYLAFQRLVTEIANPALAAARNDLVLASTISASAPSTGNSVDAERAKYIDALQVLDAALRWVLQPAVLDTLTAIPSTMRGEHPFEVTFVPPGSSTPVTAPFDAYTAARSIQALLFTRSLAALELARTGAIHPTSTPDLQAAHRLATVAFLEGRALGTVLDAWGIGSTTLGATLEGIVQPSVHMTAQLLSGANAFGYPDGFVPFDYGPGGAGSNFEQVLAEAETPTAALQTSQTGIDDATQALRLQAQARQAALLAIKQDYEIPIQEACGTDFDLAALDWTRCGVHGGSVLGLRQGVDLAASDQNVAFKQVSADRQKIQIATDTLAANQMIDEGLIAFTDDNGNQIAANDFAQGMLDASEQALQVGAMAGPFNLGGLLAAGGVFAFGAGKADYARAKDQLEKAEKLQTLRADKSKEYNDAMATIGEWTVDMAQHNLEVQSKTIALAQATTNWLNAIAGAKLLAQGRAQALAFLQATADPTSLLMRDQAAIRYLQARADVQKRMYLATEALLYEVNQPQPAEPITDALFATNSLAKLQTLKTCLTGVYSDYKLRYGAAPPPYYTQISVRKQLQVKGDVVDPATGATITAGQQFRQMILAPENVDAGGSVRFSFATSLGPNNGLWSTDVCDDRILNVEAKLVGDHLGDNDVRVNLQLTGSNVLRSCQPGDPTPLRAWDLVGSNPIDSIQGGVNTFGPNDPAPQVNQLLFGQSVARATWTIEIPAPSREPANADVDLSHLDDVVLRIQHQGLTIQATSPYPPPDVSCIFAAGQ